MKKMLFGLLIPVSVMVISCKKDEGSTTTPPAATKFMTLTTGCTWNYKVTDNPSSASPTVTNYTLTANSGDTTVNTRTYKIFTNNMGPNEYYNITGSDYYTFRNLPASLGDTSVAVLYLKDNLAVNATWSESIPVTVATFPLTLTFNNKIAQKGINKTVNGINYTDVTDVQTTLSVSGIPAFITYSLTSDIHYFYAPKYGQIENDTKIDFTVTGVPGVDPVHFEQKTELQSATIL
jgi:hypothetical protein